VYIGDRVKTLRKKKGLNQSELAQHVGCTLRSISAIERNESQPTAIQLKYLSDYFGVSIDYLVNGIDNKTVTPLECELLNLIKENSDLYQSLTVLLNAKKNVLTRLSV
jgi:transcriptional regulator with XRE-family HTH domain